MLRHFSNYRTYWFCRHCWQEMPNLTAFLKNDRFQKYQPINSSVSFRRVLKKNRTNLLNKQDLKL